MPLALKLKQQQEQTDYVREIFEYLVIGTDRSILADKPAILLLFTFFSMQPTNPWGRVNIPVTKDEFVHLKSQVQKYCQEQDLDVVYVFNKLLSVNAFEFVPTHEVLSWGTKFVPKERLIPLFKKKDVYHPPTAISTLFSDGSISKKLESLTQDYSDIKSSLSLGESMLDCVNKNLASKINTLVFEYDQDNIENTRRKESNLGISVPTAIKQKSFATPVDVRGPLLSRVKTHKSNTYTEKSNSFNSKSKEKLDYIPKSKS